MERPKDFYRILGVTPDASVSAIKRAYRRLARQLSPQGGGAADLADLQQAYETLSDAERRRHYDESRQAPDSDWPEASAWSLVRGPVGRDLLRPARPATLAGELVLSPREAQAGGLFPVEVPVVKACTACKGTGGQAFDCLPCQGEGKVHQRMPVPLQVPSRVRPGTVFQVFSDGSEIQTILLTVHVRSA